MSHDDFAFEPVRGLPARLPEGEHLLWQGAPNWKNLAIEAYQVRKIALYFLALVIWRISIGVSEGHTPEAVLLSCAWLAGLGGFAIGVLTLLAFTGARTTVYSITSERVILRFGVAVPMTVNIPFSLIESAAVKARADGSGSIALSLRQDQRVGYLVNWPHVRPWYFARPQPSFRALDQVRPIADLLIQTFVAYNGANAVRLGAPDAADGQQPAADGAAGGIGSRSPAAA